MDVNFRYITNYEGLAFHPVTCTTSMVTTESSIGSKLFTHLFGMIFWCYYILLVFMDWFVLQNDWYRKYLNVNLIMQISVKYFKTGSYKLLHSICMEYWSVSIIYNGLLYARKINNYLKVWKAKPIDNLQSG